jgi:hypothetical protein
VRAGSVAPLSPEKFGDIVLLHIQMREVGPGERIYKVPPHPLNRAELGTIGRQAHEADVFR